MPKVLVREVDKTTAGAIEYSNFAVVVPGIVNPDKESIFDDAADENGVFECSSTKVFKNIVGQVKSYTTTYEAAPPILSKLPEVEYDDGEDEHTPKAVTLEYFLEYYKNLYLPEPPYEGETREYGKLFDGEFEYKPLQQKDWELTGEYVYIKPEDRGHDAITNGGGCGNEMAYRLLELGYTVLFKKLTDLDELKSEEYWECLLDKSNYDFRYVVSGGVYDAEVYAKMVNICKSASAKKPTEEEAWYSDDSIYYGRGDCIALIDIIEDELVVDPLAEEPVKPKTQSEFVKAVKTQVNGWVWADKNTGIFTPKVIYNVAIDPIYNPDTNYCTMPASFHYLNCAARAFENYNEWYAVGGYARGIGYYTVSGTTYKLGELAVNALEPRVNNAGTDSTLMHAVNVVTYMRGSYYMWGNRTAHALEAKPNGGLIASHFLNIRQLCCSLKKQIYMSCRRFTFDPNSDLLWSRFCAELRPILEKMKGDQGIKDYKFVKVKCDIKAMLKAKIKIIPIEAVEDFDISLYLEDSISGTTVSIDEAE